MRSAELCEHSGAENGPAAGVRTKPFSSEPPGEHIFKTRIEVLKASDGDDAENIRLISSPSKNQKYFI